MSTRSWWDRRVVPGLVEKACRSTTILTERQRWVPRAVGRVLELGVGSGLNLAFYDPTHVQNVIGIDVSPELLARAQARATTAPVAVELRCAPAEALPFADHAFDTVLVTYSLCSVDDLDRALAEVRRVLTPDGSLIFVEHGLAQAPRVAAWQRRLTPAWRRIGGGCRLDRDILAHLTRSGFATADCEQGPQPDGWRITSYTYQGRARPLPL